MAEGAAGRPPLGFTRLTAPSGKAAGICLQRADGNDSYLWVDTNGDLRIGDPEDVEASDFDPDSDGTIVGTQS